MADLNGITHLTFDCYGTLIDWEAGILNAAQPLFAQHGVQPSPEEILKLYVKHEARLEAQPSRPYREVLRGVLASMSAELGVALSVEEMDAFPASLPTWLPFPDTVSALRRLKRRFRLVTLSNVDDALFAETAKRLEVPFDEVITAEQVRSYKPGEAHFREALLRLNVPATQILHVAQSLYHDHVPAKRLGFRTAWVDRPSRLAGTGLSPSAAAMPDITVPDLAYLAREVDSDRP